MAVHYASAMPIHGPAGPATPAATAGWQSPPFNRWSFWHVGELLPTHRIRASKQARQWPVAGVASVDVGAVRVMQAAGGVASRTVRDVVAGSFTDAWVVVHDGELVDEWYAESGAADLPHAVMSVTKSLVGCVAGVLADQGRVRLDDTVTRHVPELAGTGYDGATVQHVLDMRSGVSFSEDYADPESDIRRLDGWTGWRPQSVDDVPRGLYAFLAGLRSGGRHGGSFSYRSAETDVLGWVCERATGTPMAELITTLLWGPMGAEHDAEIICDGVATAIHDGGLSATARDLARFGQLLLDGGAVPGDGGPTQVLPAGWLRSAWAVDSDTRSAFRTSPAERSFPGGWYRNQLWFRPVAEGDVMLCLGIHGQMIHVNHHTRTVCVKLSSWPTAQDPARMHEALTACDTLGAVLSGTERLGRHGGLEGVVSGSTRRPPAHRSCVAPIDASPATP
jgi:CubicO group peptidase (beta-lactamase class C family)